MMSYCAGVLKLELCDHVATISSLDFAPSPSVLLVSASMDGTLKLWDMSDDGNMIKTLRTNCTVFYGCRWSPDATALATVGNYHSVNIIPSQLLTLCGAKVVIVPHQMIRSWYTSHWWGAITFDTARRGLGGAAACPGPSLLSQM